MFVSAYCFVNKMKEKQKESERFQPKECQMGRQVVTQFEVWKKQGDIKLEMLLRLIEDSNGSIIFVMNTYIGEKIHKNE